MSVEPASERIRIRRTFIGGSDARIIMGDDETALLRLWREKRGEAEPADLSGNLIVQLGLVTEDLNRRWYEANSGQVITDIQRRIHHPGLRWMAATWRSSSCSAHANLASDSSCLPPEPGSSRQAKRSCSACLNRSWLRFGSGYGRPSTNVRATGH